MSDTKVEQEVNEVNEVNSIAALIRRLDQIELALSEMAGIDDRVSNIAAILTSDKYVKSIAGAVYELNRKMDAPTPVIIDAVIHPWDATNVDSETLFQVVVTGVGEELSFGIYSNLNNEVKRLDLSEEVYQIVLGKLAEEVDVVIGKMYAVELMTGGVNEAS